MDGKRYVGEVVELLDESEFRELDRERRCGVIRKQETAIYWNSVAWRTHDGNFEFAYRDPTIGDDERAVVIRTFDRIAAATDRPREAVIDEFHAKYRYVRYLVREEITDFDTLFDLLADLETNEAATVERLHRQSREAYAGGGDGVERSATDD